MNTPIRIRLKGSLGVCVLAAFALLIALQPGQSSAQLREVTLEDLTKTSTAVVIGKTEAPRSFWNEKRTQILTEVKIRVDESVKGDAGGETVITIPGGRVGNTLYEVSDMPVFKEGEEVLVFLWRHPSGKQLVTGGPQGKLEIVAGPASRGKMIRGALREGTALAKSGIIGPDASPVRPLEDVVTEIKGYIQK